VKAGWITPTKQVFECGYFNHLAVVKENPTLQKYIPNYESLVQGLDETRLECERLDEEEGHHYWHVYGSEEDYVMSEMADNMRDNGCIRYVVIAYRKEVYFEGYPEAIKQLYEFCIRFAAEHQLFAEFDPLKE